MPLWGSKLLNHQKQAFLGRKSVLRRQQSIVEGYGKLQKCSKYHSGSDAKKMNILPARMTQLQALEHRFLANYGQTVMSICQFPPPLSSKPVQTDHCKMQKCDKYHSGSDAKKMNVLLSRIIEVRALQHRFVANLDRVRVSAFLKCSNLPHLS